MTGKERLRVLAEHLKTVPDRDFSMGQWWCGTAGCAVGHAAICPALEGEGLSLVVSPYNAHAFRPLWNGMDGWCAVQAFFDLSEEDAVYLFAPDSYHVDSEDDITTEDVIARINRYLERE